MADELKLDIVVDEHGSAQKLADVDAGVNKVVASADKAKPSLDELGNRFGVNTVNLKAFQAETAGAGVGVSRLALGVGVAVPVITFLGAQLRGAADDARKFTDAAGQLGGTAQGLQALTLAAADNKVTFDQLNTGLQRLQERIGSGKLNDELRTLRLDLTAFKQLDIDEQFLQIAEAIEGIGHPLDRAAMKARVFGTDAQEMGRLAKAGFREAVEGAETMSAGTIKAFNDMEAAFDRTVASMMQKSKVLIAETAMYFLDPLGRGALADQARDGQPTPPGAPKKDLPGLKDQFNFAPDNEAWMQHLELQHRITEEGYRQDEVLRNIAEAEALIVKSGGDWADVLSTRVSVAVDAINAKLVSAVMMNTQLTSGAQGERDRLMSKLTATTDPNATEYDKRFSEIDQEHKRKMAGVDQNDRVSAAAAENAILEATNLKVQELQQHWDGVLTKQAGAITGADTLRQSYEQLNTAMQPKGGTALPGGLVMPTGEQLATGRYFGPVTANGQPDPSRMGGAAPMQITNHINASGSVFESVEEFVRRISEGMSERELNQGVKGRR